MAVSYWVSAPIGVYRNPSLQRASVVDSAGNAYIVGPLPYPSASLPTTPGVLYPTLGPGTTSFLVKLDAQGAVVFCTYMTGYSDAIALDQNGNAYVAGIVYQGQNAKVSVVEVDSTGAKLLYSQVFGGSGGGVAVTDTPQAIAVDAQGYVYVAGTTYSPDFPVTPGAFQSTLGGGACAPSLCGGDAYLVKLNPRTSQIVYGTYLGGSSWDYVGGLAVDAAGNTYLAGWTKSADFPVTSGAFQTGYHPATATSRGYEGYVTKLNPSGSGLVYSTYLGGSDDDQIFALALDPGGAAYVTGQTASQDFPFTSGAYLSSIKGAAQTAFVTKLSADGKSLVFSTGLSPSPGGYAVAVDKAGRVIVGGSTSTPSFPTVDPGLIGPGSLIGTTCYDLTTGVTWACLDAFLTMFDAQGKSLVWSGFLGTTDFFGITSIGLDAAGNVYASGAGQGGFPISGAPLGGTAIAKIAAVGPPPAISSAGVVNAATYLAPVVMGSLVSIFGTGIASVNGVVAASSFPLPTELAGTSVWIDDVPAPILAVANVDGREQINIQAPFQDVFGSSLSYPWSIAVRSHGALAISGLATIPATQAGIFAASDGTAAIVHGSDYSLVTASNPAHAGEVILVYATALGPVTPPVDAGVAAPLSPLSWTVKPVTAQIGGVNAPVQFAGLAPGFAGLYQVNVLVPQVPPGTQPVVIAETAAGINASPPVQIPVR
jgi:uncharacterized protein (TIGR03437 family)